MDHGGFLSHPHTYMPQTQAQSHSLHPSRALHFFQTVHIHSPPPSPPNPKSVKASQTSTKPVLSCTLPSQTTPKTRPEALSSIPALPAPWILTFAHRTVVPACRR